MSASAHTPAPTNAGMLAMRRTLAGMAMCKALGLAPREGAAPAPAKARKTPRPAPAKPAPAPGERDDADAPVRQWRVVVLVSVGDAQTHVSVDVSAPGPRRAGKQARALAAQAGHVTVGVCATLSDECPQALWAACPNPLA